MLGSEMAIVPAGSADGSFAELEGVGDSVESFARFLDAQRELFGSQVDQLQKLVVTQCKLTGANPLSQEMAAGALSIKIGKRPRDLLNPKAVKYMQSIFSIKDTLGKKETREISALCGITVTQVREFFAGQRSRVRKLTRLPREKATRLEEPKEPLDVCPISVDQPLPVGIVASTNLNPLNPLNPMTVQYGQVLENYGNVNAAQSRQQVAVNSTEIKTTQEGPSCLPQEAAIDGIDSEDKKFLENIFNLMKKEQTFSGQTKLMEWVLRIHNTAVLNWFLTKGGIAILASWLSEAALEEQTTVLLVLLKVLCHLPLHKVLPVQMSAILQTVNRLRFYRSSDISNRARILLSRWSKIFIRNQAMKKPTFSKLPIDAQKEIIRKQRISEILLSDESWQSKVDIPEEILALTESNDMSRRTEPRPGLKLLTASADESNKKHSQSVSTSKNKQRRKVQLVEQPDSKSAGRSVQVARTLYSNQSRPMSADDIQKAKMRAMFMQNKYGKTDASTNENLGQKTVDREVPSASQTIKTTPASGIPQLHQLKRNEDKKLPIPIRKPSPDKMESDSKTNTTSREHLLERLMSIQTQWHSPPAMKIDSLWSVGAGENSKEVEVQTARTRREKETFYVNLQEVPSNPKEPWDTEMDFDDSLTPDVPIEQPPEADVAEASSCLPNGVEASATEVPSTVASAQPVNNAPPEPDMELLAVLLKNPELVFALTSGQGSNLTSEQTVALLDMLKKNGVGLAGAANHMAQSSREIQEPTSLPSPTPPSESRSGWRSEVSPFTRNPPPLQPHLPGGRVTAVGPSLVTPTISNTIPSAATAFPSIRSQALVSGLAPTVVLSMPQLTVNMNPTTPQNLTLINQAPKKLPATMYAQQSSNTSMHHSSLAQMHNHSSLLNPTTPMVAEYQPKHHTWLSSSTTTGIVRREQTPDAWTNRLSALPEVQAPGSHFDANQYNNRMYSTSQSQINVRNNTIAGARLQNWTSEGSSGRAADLYSNRREPGLSYRPEWPGHWNAEHRDSHNQPNDGSRRWRDRR
ncbi:hypothetical protein J5N97_015326 [Dioscorea zingiberensis]|uniref:Homeobox domain-containing protein n=1 Tax=Dioscorea zingiberensis TaxID=325984 RepID=A0A9D5CVN4_9LILI|nr:hypothetical protein J5N97_015326 [Dioscorea zingiberensis]